MAGGAANVAANIAGFGSKPVLLGVVGSDPDGEELRGTLESANISSKYLAETGARPTSVKTRVIANGQQVVRIDNEDRGDFDSELFRKVSTEAVDLIDQTDIVLISDYAKGMVTSTLVDKIVEKAHASEKLVLVDPKGKDYRKYGSADVITPNQKEALDAAGFEETDEKTVTAAGKKLINDYGYKQVLITRGEAGYVNLLAKRGRSEN